ncbi:ribosomal biogenesis factor-like isoform X2 [Sorex araneus]|uniref:ribosomal biogenesis factor-like isoform X2 n=1 Tax=Sorex araneus TaxID=42254 RepID=UPI002433528E|nr:ribosomal biogenesis factor-like isoform X2 [Sorex araneus]
MARSKLRGQKTRNVFHIATQKHLKAKNTAKSITTNLKKINIKPLVPQQCHDNEPGNVDKATKLMAQL